MIKIKRKRIRFFAKWAIIKKPFNGEKHYIKNHSICYDIKKNNSYSNHIEMSGLYCSAIISYGTDKNENLRIMRHVIFPSLRNYPNTTHSSLDYNFKNYKIFANNFKQTEKVTKFIFDGALTILSHCKDISIKRTIYPANTKTALCENLEILNTSSSILNIKIKIPKLAKTMAIFGHNDQRYQLSTTVDLSSCSLNPRQSKMINIAFCGSPIDENILVDNQFEYSKRLKFVSEMKSMLIINSPNSNINLMAYYAKIRAAESIFITKGGLMHSPGGGGYYAAIWTNDQCEYINPLFGYLGYQLGVEQAKNSYDMYKKFISNDTSLITSIIAEGDGIWHGAKDRGDSAMYAYGVTRFLLTMGDKQLSLDYIDYIDKCLEYTLSQINCDGVVASDSDELEGRFLTGKANLCTSSITYDALMSAYYLHKDLGNIQKSNRYLSEAIKLYKAINSYFSKNVEGFDTYMYCKEESNLRSWIAMPLVVGIFDRAEKTKDALLSDKLRVREGLLTRSGETTFWDRSTLYTLRGLFFAGFPDEAYELLSTYTKSRLLGEHIPYAVEAFPEGNQAQLSAESGLYLRIFVEGILGFRPIGLGKFVLKPSIPKEWGFFEVDNIVIANKKIKIKIESERKIEIIIKGQTNTILSIQNGEEVNINLY